MGSGYKKEVISEETTSFVRSSYQLSNHYRRLHCHIRVHGLVRHTPYSLYIGYVPRKIIVPVYIRCCGYYLLKASALPPSIFKGSHVFPAREFCKKR